MVRKKAKQNDVYASVKKSYNTRLNWGFAEKKNESQQAQ